MQKADELNVPCAVAVVDDSGNLIYLEKKTEPCRPPQKLR
ncbi:MAG: heme-binding protein [Bacteroidales bacterium]|nr:heme-binding protein [Bacteroidales bacterium]